MKIAISTDSRGVMGEKAWVSLLIEKFPEHEYFTSLWTLNSFTSIFNHTPCILAAPGGNFDWAILQLGFHEYVVPWRKCFWYEELSQIDPNFENNLSEFPKKRIGSRIINNSFTYRNDALVKKYFELIRTKANKILFISMPYSWKALKNNTNIMNKVYSNLSDKTIWLPMDRTFSSRYTMNTMLDRVHYTDNFHRKIVNLVAEAINI